MNEITLAEFSFTATINAPMSWQMMSISDALLLMSLLVQLTHLMDGNQR
jgi:hypothetical protein